MRPGRRALVASGLLLAGCATYRPAPLPTTSALARDASSVRIEAEVLRGVGLAAHPFDPADGLDLAEVAMLAVSNNLELRAARARAGVARSQLFAAGLLPDPVLSVSADVPFATPGAVPGLGLGLREALDALVSRPSRVAAAEAEARSVDLGVLWQEWQTAQMARLLFVKVSERRRKIELLERRRALYSEQRALDARALKDADVTLEETTARAAALFEIEAALGAQRRQEQADEDELRAVLGLAPEAPLVLQGPPRLPPPTDDEVSAAVRDLPSRRPDLLALRAGYESQEARLRAAVLEQFPSVEAQVGVARGTDRTRTIGLSIGLRLPLFDRNRGAIAVEEATREQLRLEVGARLARAEGEAHRLWAEHRRAEADAKRLGGRLPQLESAAGDAERAYGSRDLTGPARLGIVDAFLRSQYDLEDRRQTLLEARVALEAVLGPARELRLPGPTAGKEPP